MFLQDCKKSAKGEDGGKGREGVRPRKDPRGGISEDLGFVRIIDSMGDGDLVGPNEEL